jgi:hypothetical protein
MANTFQGHFPDSNTGKDWYRAKKAAVSASSGLFHLNFP